jgi:hypothetical protein
MSPFYRRLPTAPGVANDVTADQIGLVLIGGVAALSAAHGVAAYTRNRRSKGTHPPGPAPAAAGTSAAAAGDAGAGEGERA